jgi:lipopolysaccharide transport system permease protein
MSTLVHTASLGDPSLTVPQALARWLADLRQHSRLIRTLFRRLYWNRFKGSALGYFWVFVMPCIPLAIYTSLQYLGVFNTSADNLPRAVYTGWGIVFFLAFADTLRSTTGALVTHRRDILQTGIPKMALIAVSTLHAIGDLAMRSAAFLVVLMIFHQNMPPPSPWLLLAPLFALALVTLAFSLGCVLSLVIIYYRDLLNLLTAALGYLFFASGVFMRIPVNNHNPFFEILRLQPVYLIIEQSRHLCLLGPNTLDAGFTAQPWALAATLLLCFATLPLALTFFYRGENLVNNHL